MKKSTYIIIGFLGLTLLFFFLFPIVFFKHEGHKSLGASGRIETLTPARINSIYITNDTGSKMYTYDETPDNPESNYAIYPVTLYVEQTDSDSAPRIEFDDAWNTVGSFEMDGGTLTVRLQVSERANRLDSTMSTLARIYVPQGQLVSVNSPDVRFELSRLSTGAFRLANVHDIEFDSCTIDTLNVYDSGESDYYTDRIKLAYMSRVGRLNCHSDDVEITTDPSSDIHSLMVYPTRNNADIDLTAASIDSVGYDLGEYNSIRLILGPNSRIQ